MEGMTVSTMANNPAVTWLRVSVERDGTAVWEGPIAPWFEQPGGGLQQKLDRALVPGDGALNVAWLLSNGYLVRIN